MKMFRMTYCEWCLVVCCILIFGVSFTVDQLLVLTNRAFPKDKDKVEVYCFINPGTCTFQSWINNKTHSTLCICEKEVCTPTQQERYKCYANDTTITFVVDPFLQRYDSFPLTCQCGIYTAVFDFAPERPTSTHSPGPTSTHSPDYSIIGGAVGGVCVIALAVSIFACICQRVFNHGGDKNGEKKDQKDSGLVVSYSKLPQINASFPSTTDQTNLNPAGESLEILDFSTSVTNPS